MGVHTRAAITVETVDDGGHYACILSLTQTADFLCLFTDGFLRLCSGSISNGHAKEISLFLTLQIAC